jgi:iron complex outermembrane receptor protein
MRSKTTRTNAAIAGLALTQVAIAVGALFAPAAAHAQSRPNIEETLPAVPGKLNYAQSLVDRISARHPELLQVDIHAVPPGSQASVIVAAKDRSRVGKPSDPDDIEVARTGQPRVEINRVGNNNVEVEVPLLSVTRETVGAIELTFPYVAGTDRDALLQKANDIADEFRRRIAHGPEDLVTPAQWDGIPPDSYAQYLVDDTLEHEPGLAVLVLHGRDASGGYPIIASNIGRIGKAADESDLAVIRSGQEVHATSADGRRFEVKMPMRSAAGEVVGAVAVVFPRRIAADDALVAQAEKIRDQLATRIATAQNLAGPYPRVAQQPVDKIQTPYDKQELGNQQSLPMTKAVTSGATLEQAAQEGYSEAIKGVAGVSPANSKGTANDSINIRGIKLNLFANYRLNGGLPVVGLITVPTEDKERIETLKGANALMFGVASPAGIINLVTKRAGPIDVTSIGIAGNSFGQIGESIDIGRRIGAQKELGIRVNAAYVDTENGIHNTRGHGKFWSLGFDYRMTDRLTVSGDYEYYTRVAIEQGGVSLLAPVNGIVPITPVPNPRNLLSGTWNVYPPHTRNQQIRFDYVINDNWKALFETGRSDGDRRRFTVRIGNYNIVTGANGIVTVNSAVQEYKNAFSRIETLGHFDTWFLTHDLTLGVSKSERDAISLGQNQTVLTVRQNIFDPIELPPPVFTKPDTVLPLQASADTGIYGYDTIGVTRKLKALLGMRHTRDDESTGGSQRTISNVNSPAYGALYDVVPSVTLFASYMEGLEAGGTAPATAVNANSILPSAKSKQKEVGIRDSHIRGLSLSASYFDITRANAVTDPVTRIFANSGDIDYKGLEATAGWDFARNWHLRLAGQWLKAKQVTSDPTFNGFWPENTPKALANGTVSWRVPRVAGLTLSAGVSGIAYRYVNNQQQGTIPGYALYNAGIGYVTRFHGKRVAFQLNADNLANLRYWNSVQTGTYGIGMDRSIKFNVRMDF